MIPVLLIGSEIAFWVFVAAGLACRYLLRRPKLGVVLLACTPVIDLVILLTAYADLRNGGTAGWAHGLSAVYIGGSLAFGSRMIRWADLRFAHWFAGGPAPVKKYGAEHARYERSGWLLHAAAWIIGCGLLYGMMLLADEGSTESLLKVIRIWTLVLGLDFLISFSYSLWPRQPKPKAGTGRV
ncbi:hypothetical protein MJA45_26355 [Paenibacillus aurantius]|uniref:YmcC n=1 Tax=Paenibacillus aurantius TaxID=2918900 RepID=A0AA96RF45_9BACL|nr:hypothetical protein [Paenibacillus aurantius]WNQ11081.1 hypothetical protein MJA45_26355 [Paenibacillus aurantius]